jgi:hypothetical protein
MLLDKYVLTTSFTSLLSHSPAFSSTTTPPPSFVKRVNASLNKLDPLLKVLQVRPSPAEGLVQAYLIHIADRSEVNFRKVLELKGVRKQDQAHLVELFQIHRDSPKGGELVQSSTLMQQVNLSGGDGKGAIVSAAGGLALNARFDPAGFGEKLFSAARDGVERIGSTSGTPIHGFSNQTLGNTDPSGSGNMSGGTGLGISSTPSGQNRDTSMDRQTEEGARLGMNENLRNIGKFFRRDMSGFGGRFGAGGKGSVDDTVR